jgi:hypothetical protein
MVVHTDGESLKKTIGIVLGVERNGRATRSRLGIIKRKVKNGLGRRAEGFLELKRVKRRGRAVVGRVTTFNKTAAVLPRYKPPCQIVTRAFSPPPTIEKGNGVRISK